MEAQAEDVLPVEKKTGVLRESLDIKGRLQRNPYGMIAGACGIGFVLGGGLFTRLSEKLLGTGLRVVLMVALPSLEKQITKVLAGSKLNEDKENDQ
jgi:hypothetical protein